jgi:hypothetical protein
MHRILAAASAVLFAAAASSSWRDRIKSIQADNQAQQAKLGLTREKLYAQYPTPEVHFDGEVQTLACGQTSPLQLKGNYPKGTQFVLHSDDVRIEGNNIKVSKDALPGPIELEAISPVSGASLFTQVAKIDSKLKLTLQYEDGWSAKIEPTDGGYLANFSKGTATRSLRCDLTPQSNGVRVDVQPSEEQQKLVNEQVSGITTMLQDPDYQRAQKQLGECGKLDKDAQMPCFQNAMKDLSAVSERMKKAQDEQTANINARKPRDAWACNQVNFSGGNGHLTGTADCDDRHMKVTATYTCLR